MRTFKFILYLFGIFLFSQYAYAGPSSFKFVFHNQDPGKMVDVWMYKFPLGAAFNTAGKTIPYKDENTVFIAQNPAKDSYAGIKGYWVIRVKDKNGVDCAVQFRYSMGRPYGKWVQSENYDQYQDTLKCPTSNKRYTALPKGSKPVHGTKFYTINIFINAGNVVFEKR